MTPYEREHPECLNPSRRNRIAKGSGTQIQDVNRLTKQFDDMRKLMHKMSSKSDLRNMMRNMPKMPGGFPRF